MTHFLGPPKKVEKIDEKVDFFRSKKRSKNRRFYRSILSINSIGKINFSRSKKIVKNWQISTGGRVRRKIDEKVDFLGVGISTGGRVRKFSTGGRVGFSTGGRGRNFDGGAGWRVFWGFVPCQNPPKKISGGSQRGQEICRGEGPMVGGVGKRSF